MKIFYTFLLGFIALVANAQAPQGFNYQATVRNNAGALMTNASVQLKFSILQDTATGTVVYSESQTKTTDGLGQVSTVVGQGTALTGTFAAINWGTGTHFLAIELNTGNGFVAMGTTQLLSVPYALYANKSAETAALQNQITALQQLLLPTITTDRIEAVTATSARVYFSYTVPDAFSGNHQVGLVWSTSPNPQVSDHYQGHVSGEAITGLTPNTTYYLKAVFDNGNNRFYYGQELTFTTLSAEVPSLTTIEVSNITGSTATTGGIITSNGGANVTARGVVWSTTPSPTTALATKTTDGTGTGTFTSTLTGLALATTYYVRAYATNAAGTAYGNEVSFTTLSAANLTAQYPAGTVHCNPNNPSDIVDVTNPTTGKTWMDRNLGASQSATSSTDANAYGDLYQWGRRSDGHQCRTSPTTSTLSSTDQPAHGSFILAPSSPNDWRSPQNTNLWQGVSGTNNPCPSGYRLPTDTELDAERTSWSSQNAASAFASPLKLPMAGYRDIRYGSLVIVGPYGYYWSSTVFSTNSRNLYFNSSDAVMNTYIRAFGNSVRCLKD